MQQIFEQAKKGDQIRTFREMRVVCSGCSHLFQDYVRGKIVISPEDLADAVYTLVPDHFKFDR